MIDIVTPFAPPRPRRPSRAASLALSTPRVIIASADDALRSYLADHLWVDGAEVVEIARCPTLINTRCSLDPAAEPADLFIADARAMKLGALVALTQLGSGREPARLLLLVPAADDPDGALDDEDLVVLGGDAEHERVLGAARGLLHGLRA